jgi:hypothetical protein
MKSGLVELYDRSPNRLDIVAPEPNGGRLDFQSAACGDFNRVEDANPPRTQTPYFPTSHAYLLTN